MTAFDEIIKNDLNYLVKTFKQKLEESDYHPEWQKMFIEYLSVISTINDKFNGMIKGGIRHPNR